MLIAAAEPALPVRVANELAVETSDALEEYVGEEFEPADKLSKFQVASVTRVVHEDGGEGWELTINVSEAELPVSVVPIFRVLVVLL